jgi:hypothetical protein
LQSTLQVKEISVITNGLLYGGRKLSPNFRMLDGNGGGEDTRITDKSGLACRNNFLLTWGTPEKREVLVAGGITYQEIEKFVRVTSSSDDLEGSLPLPDGLNNPVLLDAGRDSEINGSQVSIKVVNGNSYHWETGAASMFDDILYDKNAIVLAVAGLKPGSAFSVGLAWSDDADTRVQSVAWSFKGGDLNALLPPGKLPSHANGEPPEEVWMNLPDEAVQGDTLYLHIRNEGGINAVVSSVTVCKGHVNDNLNGKGRPVFDSRPAASGLRLDLFASDPVGKRIDPGQSWFPQDAFYVSVGHDNPFEGLEQYGKVLRDFQNTDLEYYTFPTVCLWYAQHPMYGGGPSVNDAPGGVEEMDRAVKSGFLKYSPVSIRLVPDAYEENNEQGWWDEEHWQIYGTGKYANPPDGNVDVKPGHYKPPYETTKKWAGAVIERGGIPLTYFQTGRRSDDYAEAFPEHMLFNRADVKVVDNQWMVHGKGSYDFTDPGFLAHMKDVYRNLAGGGVRGLMYDYPYTAWAQYGGMEDPYSTTAAAYRTVFQLARNGLGPDAFLDERNLDHGSDITLGIVSSQRIWGDTDKMSPLMITRGALRWYKNRQVVSYDMDAKNLLKAQPANRDGIRKLLTLMFSTCGRFLMANSFDRLSPEMIHDLSRIFPYPDEWISARPVDAFAKKFPETFVFRIDPSWYQATVYNPDNEHSANRNLALNSTDYFGGMDLDPSKTYYIYEFWDDKLVGEFPGTGSIPLELRPGEAKMLSVREKADHPQLLSTDRHLMQGLEETRDIRWDEEKMALTAFINLVADEPMNLVFASNGFGVNEVSAADATGEIISTDERIDRIRMISPQSGWYEITLKYVKK